MALARARQHVLACEQRVAGLNAQLKDARAQLAMASRRLRQIHANDIDDHVETSLEHEDC